MLDHLILMLSLLGTGQVGLGTIFGSSRWDRQNPDSNLACLNREINDRKDFVIAHNELPCGTKVLIFNPRTGRSTMAEVADRGPRHAYADLSMRVAQAIGHNGRENILLVPLAFPPPRPRKQSLVLTVPAPIEETWEVPERLRHLKLRPDPKVPRAPVEDSWRSQWELPQRRWGRKIARSLPTPEDAAPLHSDPASVPVSGLEPEASGRPLALLGESPDSASAASAPHARRAPAAR